MPLQRRLRGSAGRRFIATWAIERLTQTGSPAASRSSLNKPAENAVPMQRTLANIWNRNERRHARGPRFSTPAAYRIARFGFGEKLADERGERARLSDRVQLTTDGHKAYSKRSTRRSAARLTMQSWRKIYGPAPGGEKRYGPAVCIGATRRVTQGNPDQAHTSTSHIERSNLSLRMHDRRFARLTNAFSKRITSHIRMVARLAGATPNGAAQTLHGRPH